MTQAFNLSQFANKVNTSGQADLTTAVTGTLPQANGGTGTTTAANGELLIGNGSGFTKATLTQGSGVTITNASGAITIAAASSANIQTELFTAPGTWTKPSTATQVRVTVVGGGGGGGSPNFGGCGGIAIAIVPVSAPVSVTVGGGGTTNVPAGTSGGTSSFGPAVSATGGAGGSGPAAGANGSGTVSVGTALLTKNMSNGQIGILSGTLVVGGPASPPAPGAALTYSITSPTLAGSRGANNGAGPYRIGGTSGAVVVEWVS